MPFDEYVCKRCNYSINKKSNFIIHLDRKNICKPIYSDTSVYDMIYDYSLDINSFSNRDKLKQIFRCCYCNNNYLNKFNLNRHSLSCYKNTTITEVDILTKDLKQLKATRSSQEWRFRKKNR